METDLIPVSLDKFTGIKTAGSTIIVCSFSIGTLAVVFPARRNRIFTSGSPNVTRWRRWSNWKFGDSFPDSIRARTRSHHTEAMATR